MALKENFLYELWYYYHDDALRLIASIGLVFGSIVLSYFGGHSLALILLIVSTLIFLYSLLKNPKVIGMFRGIIFYLVVMTVFIWCFSNIYAEHGIINNGNEFHDFKSVLYFSIVTWTTLGYGDFQPTESVRLWASLEAFIGYVFTGILVGLIIAALTPTASKFSGKKPARKYNEKT